MSFTLEQLIEIFPDRLWLEFSSEERDRAWVQVQNYSNQSSRWTAYLNFLCLERFLQYIDSDPDLQKESLNICFSDLEETNKSSLWEFINGTAIEVGDRRLILMPRETVSLDEFSIPWEWVDIPTLAGDYYLAVEVNLEQQWLQFWGYTTHQKIKEKAFYESRDRTYNLNKDDLIEDIEVLWVAREICPPERAELEKLQLPNLADRAQQDSIAKWSQISTYSPRLELNEKELLIWAALLASNRDRLDLYERRLHSQPTICLSQWLKDVFEEGWQVLEDVVGNVIETGNDATLKPVYAFRKKNASDRESSITTIPVIVNLLKTDCTPEIRWQATDFLGKMGRGNAEAIAVLTDIIQQESDPDFRRQAAVTLKKIDPQNVAGGVRRAKLIDFGMKLDSHSMALIITLVPDKDSQVQVHFRITSLNPKNCLPANLQLEILDKDGQIFDRVVSRQTDNIIQCGLKCDRGDIFSIQVMLGDAYFQENFRV